MGARQSQLPIVSYHDRDNRKTHPHFYPDHKGIVEINQEKWNTITTQHNLQSIKSWNVLFDLSIKLQRGNLFCKQISHIKFPFLMKLNLSGNRINSIQTIGQMWFVGLESMNLSNNNITFIKELRKLKTKLKSLNLSGNKIMDMEQLTEMYSRKHRIMKIDSEKRSRYEHRNIKQNPIWILKTKFSLQTSYNAGIQEYFPLEGNMSNKFSKICKKAGKI